MSYLVPHLHWERMQDATDGDGRAVLEVPAELTALTPAARALLRVRLARRCGVEEVVLRGGGAGDVAVLVGVSAAGITPTLLGVADRAVAGVAADAAAGWTARDEAERHRPFAGR